jgi:hypothetical protein
LDVQAVVFLLQRSRQRLDGAQPNLLEATKAATARLAFPDDVVEHELHVYGKQIS